MPASPAPGNYVVVDVTHFSTTVVELLTNGAAYVHVTDERGDEFAFKEDHPDCLIGGGSSADYTPTEGYDFFNSPSYVRSLDVDGRPVAMTSTNGGGTVADLRTVGVDGVEVYVGGTTNADAVAAHLRESDAPTYVVACGSKGKPSPEDLVGAVLIGRYLEDSPPSDAEIDAYRGIIYAAKGRKYATKAEIRRRDLREHSTTVNSRTAVPKLVGRKLRDVGDAA
nr:2-phosphosulfolactate phosphatase [Halegenticoccus tardaugens]